MRTLVIFRGAPGCGKSTAIKKLGLEDYTVCPDTIRLLYSSPVGTCTNFSETTISQNLNDVVWANVFKILEKRMERGEFTVVDATSSTRKELSKYKTLALKYRYKTFVVDMTNVPLEELKRRNRARMPEYKRVPDYVTERIYKTLKTESVPSSMNVVTPEELLEKITLRKIDLSKFKAVHHIGDVHGCYTALSEFLKDGFHEDEAYIFCGDYLDRGIQNVETLQFFLQNVERENVFLLEGNHEEHLWNWANDLPIAGKEFANITAKQLEEGHISKKEVRRFCRHLLQCAYYTYNGKTVVATHGGINRLPSVFVSAREMIHGTGFYPDVQQVEDMFCQKYNGEILQFHGHRNIEKSPVESNDVCYNLEAEIEFGGHLRIATLCSDGKVKTQEIRNHVHKALDFGKVNAKVPKDIPEAIAALRSTSLIKEQRNHHVSSFNFTRKAFMQNCWTDATVKARGLFINTKTNKIVARGYEKFFKINERANTTLESLKDNLVFPVTAYVKENGFLGLVGYDEEADGLFITSKGCSSGEFAKNFKELFFKTVSAETAASLKEFLKKNNFCLIFEVIDKDRDPHIIEYSHSKIVLLDIVKRDLTFTPVPYEKLTVYADNFHFECKKKATVLKDWNAFKSFYDEVTQDGYMYDGHPIEGFVFSDAQNFMVKVKTSYYDEWKFLRGVTNCVAAYGGYTHKNKLSTNLSKDFYNWLLTLPEENLKKDIITLRKEFLSK